MSLILDALNRAEHERKNQNAVPDLNTLHRPQEIGSSSESRRTLQWVIGIVLVLVAIIIVLVVLLRREPVNHMPTSTPVPARPTPVVPSPGPVAVQTPPAEVEPPPVTSSIPVVENAPLIAPDVNVNRLYAAQDGEPEARTDIGVNELYAAEAATAAASETIVDPFNPTNDAPVAIAPIQEQAPPRTFDSIKNIPDFNSLPWNMRQQIPTISYARHNYLASGVSSVVINNQTTGVGNIIGTGQFVVQEIYVDGVVLKHGNAVFKLRALNGWINM